MASKGAAKGQSGVGELAELTNAVARLVEKVGADRDNAIANLTCTTESQGRSLKTREEQIEQLLREKLALAEALATEKQKHVERDQWMAAQEAALREKEIELEKTRAVWGTVGDLGKRVLQGVAAHRALGAAPSGPSPAQGERKLLAEIVEAASAILGSLTPDTQAAIVAEAGQERVERLFALIASAGPFGAADGPHTADGPQADAEGPEGIGG